MMPEFSVNGQYVTCANMPIGLNSKCDCGQKATVLATFRVLPPHGGKHVGKDRSGLGMLLLCPACAVEMVMMDIEAWQNFRNEEATHFMSIREAIEMGKSNKVEPEVKRKWLSFKWREILEWMSGLDSVTVAQVAKRFNQDIPNVRANFYRMVRDETLEKVIEGKEICYRVKGAT